MPQNLSAPTQPSQLQHGLEELVSITARTAIIRDTLFSLEDRLNGTGKPSILEKQVSKDSPNPKGFVQNFYALVDQLKQTLTELDRIIEALQQAI